MAQIEVYDLNQFSFMVGQDGNLYVNTDYIIQNINTVFTYESYSGNLYFTDVMPWRGLYWELQDDGTYLRKENIY